MRRGNGNKYKKIGSERAETARDFFVIVDPDL